ncbi:MAG: hypothetical protein NTY71_06905 [Methanoregula sp.]|nr:hypothetical protein [Methanoregula sp.]
MVHEKFPNEIVLQIQSLFKQYYGPNEIYSSLLNQVQSLEGINSYLQKISKFEKNKMDDAIAEMRFASLFYLCGFKVTLIPVSNEKGEERPDLEIVDNSINGLVEVKHIASKDFDKKLLTSDLKTDDECLEKYGDFKKSLQSIWDVVFDKLDQLHKYSQNKKCNTFVIAIWNSVDEIEELEAQFSAPSIASHIAELNRYATDILLIYGSNSRYNTYFHAIPLYRKSNVINPELIQEIERKSRDEIFGTHRISLHELLKSKNI